MGIPSYYRFLIEKHPSLVKKQYHSKNKKILCYDLNCIIYNCLGKATYDGTNLEEYEKTIIQETCKYIEFIWKNSGRCEEVFLAVDGVVPMAKMKQQRLRRFKSIVLAQYEIQQQVRSVNDIRWDSNAITPGTLFMKKLDVTLQMLCKSHSGWSLSGYDKPGEGEQKIMSYIRNSKVKDNTIIVYGLDADLILLSMLHSDDNNLYLMREEMEFNKVIKDAFNEPTFLYFDINALKTTIIPDYTREKLLDYIMMMSLLGNDFLPHSIAFTIKETGHTFLYDTLKQYNKHLVDSNNKIIWKNLSEYLTLCTVKEESGIEQFCKKKNQIKFYRVNKERSTEYDMKMAPIQILPCQWFVEKEIYCSKSDSLKKDWKENYYNKFLISDIRKINQEYSKGLQWIIDYYLGNPIEYDWYFPWLNTPLWVDFTKFLGTTIPKIHYKIEQPLEPEQQLAIVLPLESYSLITNEKYKKLPKLYPQFYPTKYGFHSLGKKWFYECESNIPIFSSRLIRSLCLNSYEINN